MLYREIITAYSQIHTKHINALFGQNVELLNVKLAVHIVTTGPYRVHIAQSVRLYTGDSARTTKRLSLSPLL
jgi:hypothetical protein